MKLHELYFSNLGGSKLLNPQSELYKTLSDQYGGFETWKQDFIDTGTMRGIGWVILYRDPKDGRLVNTWINEHDVGHPGRRKSSLGPGCLGTCLYHPVWAQPGLIHRCIFQQYRLE